MHIRDEAPGLRETELVLELPEDGHRALSRPEHLLRSSRVGLQTQERELDERQGLGSPVPRSLRFLDCPRKDEVGTCQLAGIAKCSAEIRGEREAAWLVVAEERVRAREQSDGRGRISTSRGPPARGGQEVGRAGRKGPSMSGRWRKLGAVLVGLLEVVAEDFLVLAEPPSPLLLQPDGVALVQEVLGPPSRFRGRRRLG